MTKAMHGFEKPKRILPPGSLPMCISTLLGALTLLCTIPIAVNAQDSSKPSDRGMIIFASDRFGHFDIFSMNPDGSELRRLTSDSAGKNNFPEFGPGRKYFTYLEISPISPYISLWIRLTATAESRKLIWGVPISDTAISPDGKYIAISNPDDIYIFDLLSGGLPRKLTSGPKENGHSAQWSPDGTHIVFASNRSGFNEIWVMDSSGRDAQQLTHLQLISGEPSWSPDGSQIAFFAGTRESTQLMTIGADGSDPRTLTNSSRHNGHPCWAPDGMSIVFWSNRTDKEQIYTIDADGENERQITQGDFNDENPFWAK